MVYRIFVEKKKELAHEAHALLSDARTLLGITALEDVRLYNRYDAENITGELFDYASRTVFSMRSRTRAAESSTETSYLSARNPGRYAMENGLRSA